MGRILSVIPILFIYSIFQAGVDGDSNDARQNLIGDSAMGQRETSAPPPAHLKYTRDGMHITNFRLHKLGLGYYADIAEKSNSAFSRHPIARNNDVENPGNYYQYPYTYSIRDVDSTEIVFLEGLLSEFLQPEYYSDEIFSSIENIYLPDLERLEFFYEVELNSTRFRLTGWYEEFIHVYVYTDFDSKAGFIERARQYFNLPDLDISKVSYDEEIVEGMGRRDFFYSYDDPEAEFKLNAYPFLKREGRVGGAVYSYDGMVLDLTIYAEEE